MLDFKRIYTTPDKRTALMKKNIIGAFVLKGASIIISFVAVPMTLGYLTSFEYGVWLTLSSILHWLDFFDVGLANGLRNKLTESIAKEDFHIGQIYVSTTFCFLFLITGVAFILFLIANSYLNWDVILNTLDNPIPHLNEIVLIVFAMCCMSFMMKTVGIIYVSFQKPVINNLISFIGQFLSLVILYVLTLTTDGNLGSVAIAFSACPLLVYILAYPYTFGYKYKQLAPSFKYVDFKYAKSLVGLGIKFFVIQIACLILFTTSNLIITQLFSPNEVTPYNLAFKYISSVHMLFVIIQTPLWSAITDAFARKDYLWIGRAISRQLRIWTLCSLGIVLLICLKSFVFHIWIGDKLEIPYSLVVILGLYHIFFMLSMVFGAFANGTGRLKVQLYAAIAQSVLYIPLAIFLSKPFGLNGIALALMLVSLIPAIAQGRDYYIAIKQLKNNYFKFRK